MPTKSKRSILILERYLILFTRVDNNNHNHY
jgi:hypothetical protein